LQECSALNRAVFAAAADKEVGAAVRELGLQVAANDRAMWGSSKSSGRFKPKADTYLGEVAFVRNWYRERYLWMDSQLTPR